MKYFFETYGCQMNVNDSDNMRNILNKNNFSETDSPFEAQIILIVTCAVRESAEDRINGRLGFYKSLKEKQDFILIFCGCIAQEKKAELLKTYPFIDIIIGTAQVSRLGEAIDDFLNNKQSSVYSSDDGYKFITEAVSRAESFRAFVNIIHGCNNFCSYCIVPYVRGREKSRPSTEIINEINRLYSEGVKELTLLGQNVNSYGKDLKDETDFPGLLKKILKNTQMPWIHFITSHPKDFNSELVDVAASDNRISRYFHLPFQSGSDLILKKMNRKYNRKEYLDKVKYLRSRISDAAISTDILVGFPGETEKDFEDTLSLMKHIEFDKAFMFKYSPRTFTAAAQYKDLVPEKVSLKRLETTIALQRKISLTKLQKKINKSYKVLIIKKGKKPDQVLAHNIHLDSIGISDPGLKIGNFYDVRITDISGQTLIANKI